MDALKKSEEHRLLEDFIFNNSDLETLENIIEKFNIFLSLGIINAEIRHSHFLSWILSPSETHGMGDYFLKLFLKNIAVNNQISFNDITIFQVNAWDLDGTLVYKEWNGIDILLINHTHRFLCVIENKVDSSEHDDQLTRYREIVDENYSDYKKLFIYLTVGGDRPEKEEIYISLSYEQLGEMISRLLENKRSQLSSEIIIFISHYLEMIKRFIMENSQVQEICKQIYEKHQKALDLIFKYKPDVLSNVADIIGKILDDYTVVIKDHTSASYVRFLPRTMDFIPLKGEGWTRSKRILLFEIQINTKGVSMLLIIGPGDPEIRKNIYEHMMKSPFKGATKQLYAKWTTVYKLELAKLTELEGKSIEELRSKFKSEFDKFFAGDYNKINSTLKELKKSYATTE